MRLFIAVLFDADLKNKLSEARDEIRCNCLSGSFTLTENLHLTIVFLGEIKEGRLPAIRSSMDEAVIGMAAFDMEISGFGSFRRQGGDIIWAGINKTPDLTKLYAKLAERLSNQGFEIEKRNFTPHLTLARQAKMHSGFDLCALSREVPPSVCGVNKISLMKSERIRGKLTYTEIYEASFNTQHKFPQ